MLAMKKIDIKAGDMTYYQRIELGKILSNKELSDVDRFNAVFECLHNKKPNPLEYTSLLGYYKEIFEGIVFWSKLEEENLHYEPTDEEIRAGIKEYQKMVGDLSSVHSLARNFSKDPDEILKWKYSKVFGIFIDDLEKYKYQQRYQKIITSKLPKS